MEPRPCVHCGTPTDELDRWCDDCIVAKTAEERIAQGLPPRIEDEAALDRIAHIATLPGGRKREAA